MLGLNTYKGKLTYRAVGDAFGLESVPPSVALSEPLQLAGSGTWV
jgi:alanine dehydrogenase